jgi:hypothetical protein
LKCVIEDCDREAHLPYFACNEQHGFKWNQIKSAIKEGRREYLASPFHTFKKYLSQEEMEYYGKHVN